MIQPLHQALLQRLAAVCELSPDIRFGQLVDFVGLLAAGESQRNLPDIEDDELLAALEEHHKNLLDRQSMSAGRSA
ncbi:MAG TPA: hypothetical protein VFV87_22470 [Pirellulaceae bacterium]|nr:hypothetical protein [Pirellulaceae bacterium]